MPSKYQILKREALEQRAFELYKEGLSLRLVAERIGRSHEWVRVAVDKQEREAGEPMNTDTIKT